MTQKIILYGSPTCYSVPIVRGTLQRAEVEYEYVDIYLQPEARKRVVEINNGNASVPTLVFPDGSTLTEPSEYDLKTKLVSMGYDVPNQTLLDRVQNIIEHPIIFILGILILAFGIYNGVISQTALGAALVILRLLFLLRRR